MGFDSERFRSIVVEGAAKLGVQVQDPHVCQFERHAIELLKWNRKKNLTAIVDTREVAVKHFVDSVALVPSIPDGASVLDIGSGGGFPGLPLKVMCPGLPVTLIDASRKKVSFLRYMIRFLKMKGIEAHAIRAEDLTEKRAVFQEKEIQSPAAEYDVIVSRALSSLEEFIIVASPLLNQNGVIIAMKGKTAEDEIASLKKRCLMASGKNESLLDSLSIECRKYRLPFLGSERAIVYVSRHST